MSKGGLGKSVEAEFRAAWLLARGIDWRGSDLDDRHRTFSGRHPNRVAVLRSESPEEAKEAYLATFISSIHDAFPVHIVDSRAQADEFFVDAAKNFNFLSLAAEHGVRSTLFIFPSDELETMGNLTKLVQFCAHRVDFVIVENPARSGSRLFKNSTFEKTLLDLGAKKIRLPTISSPTMLAMEGVEHKLKRGISFAEFATRESGHLEPLMAAELQYALTQMYTSYDAIADVLLPTALAARVQLPKSGGTLKVNVANDDERFGFNFNS